MKRTSFMKIYFILIVLLISLQIIFSNVGNISQKYIIMGIIFLGCVNVIANSRKQSKDIFHPKILIPFIYMFYALGPLYFADNFKDVTVMKYLLLQFLGLIFLYIGLNISVSTGRSKNKITDNKKTLKMTVLVLLILSIVSSASEVYTFGGITNLLRVGYGVDRYNTLSNSTSFGAGFQWLLLSGVLSYYYGYIYNNKFFKVNGLSITLLTTLLFLKIGGRSTIFYVGIYTLTIFNYEIKRIRKPFMLILLIVGIVFAQYYSYARFYLPSGILHSFHMTNKIIMTNPSLILPLPWNINEFRIPARSLLELIEYGSWNYKFGLTYISALGSPIPIVARITNKIGINPSKWLLQEFHPEAFLLGAGYGYSPVSEGYFNFGIFGVALHMLVYGYVINRIHSKYSQNRSTSSLLLLAGSMPIFMLDGLRIHSASFIYKLFRVYLIPYILYELIKFLNKNR